MLFSAFGHYYFNIQSNCDIQSIDIYILMPLSLAPRLDARPRLENLIPVSFIPSKSGNQTETQCLKTFWKLFNHIIPHTLYMVSKTKIISNNEPARCWHNRISTLNKTLAWLAAWVYTDETNDILSRRSASEISTSWITDNTTENIKHGTMSCG